MSEKLLKIILMEHVNVTKLRIMDIIKSLDIDVLECNSKWMLSNYLKNYATDLCCIIIHIDYEYTTGFDLIKGIREKNKDIPVVVLTTNKKRGFYMKAMQTGVTDFILIPFLEDTLVSKIRRYAEEKANSYIEIISFNLEKYLKGELRKAQKGSFPISLMFTTLCVKKGSSFQPNELEINYYCNIYFNEIKKLFWETDIFVRFNIRNYLGVFPFCDNKSSIVIREKVTKTFKELKQNNTIPEVFDNIITFSSFPEDADNIDKLQQKLIDKANKQNEGLQIKWYKINN